MASNTQRWLAKVNVLPSELVKKETPTPDKDLAEYAMVLQKYMATVEGELRRPKEGETHQQAEPPHPSNAKSRNTAARESQTSCGNLELAKNCPDVVLQSKLQGKPRSEGRDEV